MSEPRYRYLKTETVQGILVLTVSTARLQGDALAESLRNEFLDAVTHHAADKVVIDLQHIKFISSAGFRPFLTLRRKLNEKNGRMVLCNLGGPVEEAFLITRLVSTAGSMPAPFEAQPDVDKALASLMGSQESNQPSPAP